MRFYFKYQYVTSEIKTEIIKHFVNCKYSLVVNSLAGSYDLIVLMLVKNINNIYPFWQQTLERYGDYFEEQVYSNYIGESIYPLSFLLNETDDRTGSPLKRSIEKVEYDDLDFQILKILTRNSRTATIEIAKQLNVTSQTINERIKKLIKSRVILRFCIAIDTSKLGYKYFKIDFYLKEYSKRHQIIKYIEMDPHLVFVDYTLGYANLELEFYLKDVDHMNQILEDISAKFPKVIKNHTYFQIVERHKSFLL